MGRQMSVAVMMMVALAMGASGAVGAAKYSRPAEVLAAYEKAHDAGDDTAGIDCFSPDGLDKSLKFLIGIELMGRQPDPGTPAPAPTAEERKAQADLDALLAKYGVKDLAARKGEDEEAHINRLTAQVTDRRALLAKLMQLGEPPGAKPSLCRKGELTDLKITGDSATGKYAVKDPDGSGMTQDVKFKQIDGSWRLADLVMLSATDPADPAATANGAATKPAKP